MNKPINLSTNLKKLSDIATWFDAQEQVDVEEGLVKVKEAAVLIKESKLRLKEIENEFSEIKAEISSDMENESDETSVEAVIVKTTQTTISSEDIPF